jgi:hypothetical protein
MHPGRRTSAAAVFIAGLAAVLLASACWVEQIHIEPDGSDEGDHAEADGWLPAEDGGNEDVADEDAADEGGGEVTDVPAECGNGRLDPGEECDGDAPRACTDGPCAGTQTCAAGTCTWGACELGPAPVNETCSGAIDVTAGGLFSGNSCGAADDDEPEASCGGSGGRDLWYTFTLTQREVVYLDTVDGNTWDSVLQVRWGGCPLPGSPVVCSGDACPGEWGGRRSQIAEVLDPGTYLVVVDGADAAAAGPFTLRFQHAACGEASPIPGNGNYDGTTSGRTDSFASACGGSSAPDVLYFFGLCSARTVTATTCNAMSGFDSVLSFATGSCDAAHEIACNSDDPACGLGSGHSTVTAALPAGLNFLIVDGRRVGPGGAYRVTVSGM